MEPKKIKRVRGIFPIADFVFDVREKLDESGEIFGARFKVTKGAVSAWENGGSKPSYEDMLEMSRLSDIPLPGMKRGALEERVPVVGEARLGDQGYFEETPYANGSDGWVKYPGKNGTYALRCKGDSMRPRIKPGEFVVIEEFGRVAEGDEVMCQTTDGRRMIKILNRKYPDKSVELTSVNDKHDPITLDDDEIAHMHPVAAILKPSMYYPDA